MGIQWKQGICWSNLKAGTSRYSCRSFQLRVELPNREGLIKHGMFALPQTFIGILLALVITGKALSVPALIGVIMLSGIVVNNGIVLVDYINVLRRERGYSRDDAIREAGPVRLRPILMTTMTTILGMLPLAMGLGEGSDAQAPMAIVIIGGLAVSTVITLVFVPVIYTLLDDLGRWLLKAGGRVH